MNTSKLAAISSLALAVSFVSEMPGQRPGSDSLETPVTQKITLKGPNELADLAKGYVESFKKFKGFPRTLYLKYGDSIKRVDSMHSVEQQGIVLIFSNKNGRRYIVNPKDILLLTDDPIYPESNL